jgi:hypothetical protein
MSAALSRTGFLGGIAVRRRISALLFALMLSCLAFAADTYQQGKIVKWENGTYAQNNKKKPMKNWIVYQLQTDSSTYSIARQKETKPQMQAGETVQYELKKDNKVTVIDANGKKHEYQIVGQTAGQGQ